MEPDRIPAGFKNVEELKNIGNDSYSAFPTMLVGICDVVAEPVPIGHLGKKFR